MPELFRLLGFVIFFYSREHLPIHVHVEKADSYVVFKYNKETDEFVVRDRKNVSPADFKVLEKEINNRKQEIIDKWNKYFNT